MARGKPNYINPIGKGATFNVRPVPPKPKNPVVYFVQASNGLIKIGNTKYLDWRMDTLRGQSPLEIELLATTPGGPQDGARVPRTFRRPPPPRRMVRAAPGHSR
jgi:hypothetical protein